MASEKSLSWLVTGLVVLSSCACAFAVGWYLAPATGGGRSAGQPASAPSPTPIVLPSPTVNGLYYFNATGRQYWDSLEAFYAANPGFRCDYQGSTEQVVQRGPWVDSTAYVVATGHILHCYDTAANAQAETVP